MIMMKADLARAISMGLQDMSRNDLAEICMMW